MSGEVRTVGCIVASLCSRVAAMLCPLGLVLGAHHRHALSPPKTSKSVLT